MLVNSWYIFKEYTISNLILLLLCVYIYINILKTIRLLFSLIFQKILCIIIFKYVPEKCKSKSYPISTYVRTGVRMEYAAAKLTALCKRQRGPKLIILPKVAYFL